MECRKEILSELKKVNNKVKLPQNIDFQLENRKIWVFLKSNAVGLVENGKYTNMQENYAAFEGWAVAIKAFCSEKTEFFKSDKWDGTIVLDVKIGELPDFFIGKEQGHYARFLYRALRFSETYDWFSLSEKLEKVVQDFDTNILKQKTLMNNPPKGEVVEHETEDKNKSKKIDEKKVEYDFKEHPKLFQGVMRQAGIDWMGETINRQLPCGLFLASSQKEVRTKNAVFTGRKSAIDLWSYYQKDNKNVMTVVELKTKNKMIGMITEIFFYANYCRDMFGENACFHKNLNKKQKLYRGYEQLIDHDINHIEAVMLADEFHPLINDKVIEVLNQGNDDASMSGTIIKYHLADYGLDKNRNVVIKENR